MIYLHTTLKEFKKNKNFYIDEKLNIEDAPIYLNGLRVYP